MIIKGVIIMNKAIKNFFILHKKDLEKNLEKIEHWMWKEKKGKIYGIN